jgi:hypothetical protein
MPRLTLSDACLQRTLVFKSFPETIAYDFTKEDPVSPAARREKRRCRLWLYGIRVFHGGHSRVGEAETDPSSIFEGTPQLLLILPTV